MGLFVQGGGLLLSDDGKELRGCCCPDESDSSSSASGSSSSSSASGSESSSSASASSSSASSSSGSSSSGSHSSSSGSHSSSSGSHSSSSGSHSSSSGSHSSSSGSHSSSSGSGSSSSSSSPTPPGPQPHPPGCGWQLTAYGFSSGSSWCASEVDWEPNVDLQPCQQVDPETQAAALADDIEITPVGDTYDDCDPDTTYHCCVCDDVITPSYKSTVWLGPSGQLPDARGATTCVVTYVGDICPAWSASRITHSFEFTFQKY